MLAIDNDGEVRVMRNAATVLAIIHYEHWRAGCPESGHVRFGGGPSEKDQHRWYLAGGLPYRSAGSGRGRRKRTRTAGTSPAAYFTRREAARKMPKPKQVRDLAGQPTLPGVTTGHEVRESRNKGEGAQVITMFRRGGPRNAGD